MSDNLIKVAIIMSTYNGEKYLREQIDSILNQKNVDVELFIRDNGSSDSTAEIISDYAVKNHNVIFWNKDSIINRGIRDSFLTLLKEVCDEYTDINYFAFADQDDVWKSEKLYAAVKMIEENADRETPTLYYSNKTFVDADLNLISEEHIKYYGDFFEALWPSLASGCTMVFNKKMAEMSVRHLPIQYSSFPRCRSGSLKPSARVSIITMAEYSPSLQGALSKSAILCLRQRAKPSAAICTQPTLRPRS